MIDVSLANREKSRAAISSVLWSLFLTGIKIWAGLATNSLGILSEALHSGLDFCAAAITFYAVRVAAIPADKSHPYGHEKVESLSALVETLLLVLTCVWITWEAIDRIFWSTAHIDLTWWAFAVVITSILIDVNRSAMLRRVSKKHKSQALEADALHFTTDIWSSSVVLTGLCCVWAASFVSQGTFLHSALLRADSVAALVVAVLILRVSWGLSKRAIHTLMDGGSTEMTNTVLSALAKELPQCPVLQIRLRSVGSRAFVDLTVGMSPALHVDDAHDLTERVDEIVRRAVPEAETLVHVEPLEVQTTHRDDELARHVALSHDIHIHGFCPVQTEKGKILKIDIELPEYKKLGEVYPGVESFKKELGEALCLDEVIVRMEPVRRITKDEDTRALASAQALDFERIGHIVNEIDPAIKVSRIDCIPALGLLVRCDMPDSTTIAQAHETTLKIKHEIYCMIPEIPSITVELRPLG